MSNDEEIHEIKYLCQYLLTKDENKKDLWKTFHQTDNVLEAKMKLNEHANRKYFQSITIPHRIIRKTVDIKTIFTLLSKKDD